MKKTYFSTIKKSKNKKLFKINDIDVEKILVKSQIIGKEFESIDFEKTKSYLILNESRRTKIYQTVQKKFL